MSHPSAAVVPPGMHNHLSCLGPSLDFCCLTEREHTQLAAVHAAISEKVTLTCAAGVQEMNARYEAGKAEAVATLEAQSIAAADAQAALSQAAEAKLTKLQLQVCPYPHARSEQRCVCMVLCCRLSYF